MPKLYKTAQYDVINGPFAIPPLNYFLILDVINFTASTTGITVNDRDTAMRKSVADSAVSWNTLFNPGVYITSIDNKKDRTIAPIKILLVVFNLKIDFVIDLILSD